jgi:hypothetical protein
MQGDARVLRATVDGAVWIPQLRRPAPGGPGTFKLPPGRRTYLRFDRAPGAWPFLGHIVQLQRRPLALLDSLPAHGDPVGIRLGPRSGPMSLAGLVRQRMPVAMRCGPKPTPAPRLGS